MKKLVIVTAIFIALLSCNKDKFQTKPQISIKSYNTKAVQPSNDMVIKLSYTDKEGDLAEGRLVYIPKRLNRRPIPNGGTIIDSVSNPLASDFPDTDKGDLELRLQHAVLKTAADENDTLLFRFVLVDRAGNKSDTITSDNVVILK
jgi:hypothetical protein